jgi:hypothetical protein
VTATGTGIGGVGAGGSGIGVGGVGMIGRACPACILIVGAACTGGGVVGIGPGGCVGRLELTSVPAAPMIGTAPGIRVGRPG